MVFIPPVYVSCGLLSPHSSIKMPLSFFHFPLQITCILLFCSLECPHSIHFLFSWFLWLLYVYLEVHFHFPYSKYKTRSDCRDLAGLSFPRVCNCTWDVSKSIVSWTIDKVFAAAITCWHMSIPWCIIYRLRKKAVLGGTKLMKHPLVYGSGNVNHLLLKGKFCP